MRPVTASNLAVMAFAAGVLTYQMCNPEDNCDSRLVAIYRLMAEVEGRLTDLYFDKLNLKINAPQKPSPSLPAGSGSWNGHIQQLEQKQGQLRRAITDALASGCKVPPFAFRLAYASLPDRIL